MVSSLKVILFIITENGKNNKYAHIIMESYLICFYIIKNDFLQLI